MDMLESKIQCCRCFEGNIWTRSQRFKRSQSMQLDRRIQNNCQKSRL